VKFGGATYALQAPPGMHPGQVFRTYIPSTPAPAAVVPASAPAAAPAAAPATVTNGGTTGGGVAGAATGEGGGAAPTPGNKSILM
jgi:hypothetical protein